MKRPKPTGIFKVSSLAGIASASGVMLDGDHGQMGSRGGHGRVGSRGGRDRTVTRVGMASGRTVAVGSHPGRTYCIMYYGSVDPVYYVLYCIIIITVLYLYYVLSNPVPR